MHKTSRQFCGDDEQAEGGFTVNDTEPQQCFAVNIVGGKHQFQGRRGESAGTSSSAAAPHRDNDNISDKRRKRLIQQVIQMNTGESEKKCTFEADRKATRVVSMPPKHVRPHL